MKVLAVASAGGHWTQLLRISLAFEALDVVFVSTNQVFKSTVDGRKFYKISDASRWNKFQLMKAFIQMLRIIKREKPHALITTGAAPGLMGILAAKLCGVKTIWIDSIANVEELSLSGKIALRFADRVYTQWPKLSGKHIYYNGNILS
jgi:UDP-N-acetylglucosamine:LPS N-acetylglucosamine transferase